MKQQIPSIFAAIHSGMVHLPIVSCLCMGLLACKERRRQAPLPTIDAAADKYFDEHFGEDLRLLGKAVRDSVPEGWKLDDVVRLDEARIWANRVHKSKEVTEYTFLYSANPTTPMVEEGPKNRDYAEGSLRDTRLYPRKHRVDLPARFHYRGKTPPPSIEELVAGKTFVTVRSGHENLLIKVEIRRSAGNVECVIINPPKPRDFFSSSLLIYPLHELKPETYIYGVIDDALGIDRSRLLSEWVRQLVARREAELAAAGVDLNQERSRVGYINDMYAGSARD